VSLPDTSRIAAPGTWPRTREQTAETLTFPTEALRAHLTAARDLTGRELPGPIPGVLV
jgi:hypothetical protein